MKLVRASPTFILLIASLMLLLLDTHTGSALLIPCCIAITVAAFVNLYFVDR